MLITRAIRRAVTAWTLWRARRRVHRVCREIAAIPHRVRDSRGRFVSPARMRREAVHNRLRQEIAR